MPDMKFPNFDLPAEKIADFCQRWQITEFALFGSVLRDDFRPDSDVDVLVTFAPEVDWGLFDHLRMKQELMGLLNRDVDLFSKEAVEHSPNPLRRQEILNSAQVVHVEG